MPVTRDVLPTYEDMRATASQRSRLGVCQWFHYQDYESVRRSVRLLRRLGARHLRTGVSWADFHRPGGPAWYAWLFEQLCDFEILLSVWHTPPSISENGECNGPPRRLRDYADFIGQLAELYGDYWETVELWNEPNNRYKWDFRVCDPDWSKFAEMVGMAGEAAHQADKRTVLGGMIPVDPVWLELLNGHGAIEHVDVIAIHGFPCMWWEGDICWEWKRDWLGWAEKVEKVSAVADGRPIWITETGLASWDMTERRPARHQLQVKNLKEALAAPVERLYWYCMLDLDPAREAIEGFHVDENEYHLGLVTHEGYPKPAFAQMAALLGGDSCCDDGDGVVSNGAAGGRGALAAGDSSFTEKSAIGGIRR